MFQVSVEELRPLGCVPPEKSSNQPEVCDPPRPESPVSPSLQDAETSGPQDTSTDTVEEDEGESDCSGLQAEETSVLTNGELSDEEEEMLSASKRILPSSVLDQASAIAEHFISSLSRRSSLVSEDLGSLACPSPTVDSDVFKSPSACMDAAKQMLVSPSPELQGTPTNPPTPVAPEPALKVLIEGERRSTLSKQDRMLIHKIRRYYEHAEHQDASFSIKRRESLSYIPAGLVRHLSRQLNNGPQEQATPVHRRGISRNRPTSWAVFDLPGLEKRPNTDTPQPQRASKVRSQSVTEACTAEEEFRPSAEMLKVWQDMDVEEEIQEVQQAAEESLSDSRLEAMQDMASDSPDGQIGEQPILEECETSTVSDDSWISTPASAQPPALEGGSCQDPQVPQSPEKSPANHSHLPKIIKFRTSIDEDQILQDMGKVKNKVFQLARQYSQRIKNNRPMVWQRNREAEGHTPAAQPDRMHLRKRGK